MRKYAEYYISVRCTDKGWTWHIWNEIGGKILQSSNDKDYEEEDWYSISKEMAYQQAAEAIQDYYT